MTNVTTIHNDFPAGEEYVCLVCERAFINDRQLERHLLKKRHWG